jgi:aspartate beta-hydroxylase
MRFGAKRAGALPERFARYVADLAARSGNVRYPGLERRPLHDSSRIPLARDLSSAAQQMIAEFDAAAPRFHREAEPIARDGDWDVAMLLERGRLRRDNVDVFPETMAILKRHRTVVSLSGLAYFSRLGPRSRVAEHAGPVNTRLRCHLGIHVPANCGLKVGGVTAEWQAGRCIVFDDSFPHEAWNDSDQERVVLVVDFWHPDLTDEEVRLIAGVERYVARQARQLEQYWRENTVARRRLTN